MLQDNTSVFSFSLDISRAILHLYKRAENFDWNCIVHSPGRLRQNLGRTGPDLFIADLYPGSFNQKNAATWEYVTGAEIVDNWTTLVTIIDRPHDQGSGPAGRALETTVLPDLGTLPRKEF